MHKDLDPTAWPPERTPADHPLLRAILDPTSHSQHGSGFREEEVDEKLTSSNVYHVMDADPSQVAVIEDVKQGWNLVVEGPPGTGKSQTITNIIAELLAAGKSVLFVSEKMAALEVVKSRLDRVGLVDFCLELHSRKANKREVLKELERTLAAPATQVTWHADTFAQVESLKADLNAYAKALREPFGQMQRSPFALFCLQEASRRHFVEVGRPMPRVVFTNPAACDPQAGSTTVDQLRECNRSLPRHMPGLPHTR